MQPELFGGEVVSQNVDEEIDHAFGLQERAAANGFRGHKKSARTFLDVVAVCVARRPCHAQGFITSDGGMGKLFMRASRSCARALAGGKEGSLICGFTARLKPCPDTCMVNGCGMEKTHHGDTEKIKYRKSWSVG
jgi:hypothetical protein